MRSVERFADQWKDFLTAPAGLAPTAALFPAVPQGQNAGRGSNTQGSQNIISNGSRIVVPEGYGLLTFQDGQLTALVAEPGGYIWNSDDPNSQSLFAGGGIFASTLEMSWERFKFGGQPGSQQLAFYVNLKEIPNNRFGTQSEIYWDDAYLGAQVGAITRGSYSLRIVDPVLFVKQFVPLTYSAPTVASSTSPTSTTTPRASCSTRSSAPSRPRSRSTRTTRARGTASPASRRTRSGSPSRSARPSRTATGGRPTGA